MKRYFLSGGGSGGHLTPIIAVAEALKAIDPEVEIHAVVHRGDDLNSLVKDAEAISKVHALFAGKLRRYHGHRFFGIGVVDALKNIRDLFFVGLGFIQACYLMLIYRPKALLMRGGYVGVPVGFAARLFRRPYMTHDSDAVASLANRLISGGAALNAVSASPDHYPYNPGKIVETGIPLNKNFKKITQADYQAARKKLGIPLKTKVVLVTGGGLGAARLNQGASQALLPLLKEDSNLMVIHLAGQANVETVTKAYQNQANVEVYGFRQDLVDLSAASDLIITRAGATTLAEYAVQGKPIILVPNPMLTGGHQLHNAFAFVEMKAAEMVEEADLVPSLEGVVRGLLDNPKRRQELAEKAGQLAKLGAAEHIARLLIELGGR